MNQRAPDDRRCIRSSCTGRHRKWYCGHPRRDHQGADLRCPVQPDWDNRAVKTYKPSVAGSSRASASFNAAEATVLLELTKRALAGGDVRAFARINAATVGSLAATAGSLLRRIGEQREAAPAGGGEAERGSGVRLHAVSELAEAAERLGLGEKPRAAE